MHHNLIWVTILATRIDVLLKLYLATRKISAHILLQSMRKDLPISLDSTLMNVCVQEQGIYDQQTRRARTVESSWTPEIMKAVRPPEEPVDKPTSGNTILHLFHVTVFHSKALLSRGKDMISSHGTNLVYTNLNLGRNKDRYVGPFQP